MASLPQELEQKILLASNWAIVLGTVFLVSSILQIVGYFPGDLGWLNFGVALLSMALGVATLQRPSTLPLILLCVLFIAIIVDTIFTTRYVLSQFGVLAASLMLLRYAILIAAVRSMGQALLGLSEVRRIAASVARIEASPPGKAARESKSPGDLAQASETAPIELAPGPNPTVTLLVVMSILLALGGVIMAAVIPVRDGGAVFAIVGLAAAAGMLYLSKMEKHYLPKLVAELRLATANGDAGAIGSLAANLVALKGRATRNLAVAILEQPNDEAFIAQALAIIKQIGILDQDAVTALRLGCSSADEVLPALEQKPLAAAQKPQAAAPVAMMPAEFVPPAHAGHAAFVALMQRTQKEIGVAIMFRGLGIIPMHGCDVSLAGFLNHMEVHRGVVEDAARARPFDDDEYWLASFGDEILITTKAIYKLGGLPDWTLLSDIASAKNDLSLTKNQFHLNLCSGATREFRLKWSTATADEVVRSLQTALDPDCVGTLREATRSHLSRNANMAG